VTDEFMGKVGIESTVPSNNPNAVVTLVPANFKNCSINFSPSNVNRANSMQIYVTPTNPIPANGTVVFTFPVAGSWFYDIQGQPFGVTTTMVCVNLTSVLFVGNAERIVEFNVYRRNEFSWRKNSHSFRSLHFCQFQCVWDPN
jgi:hypothetical protein